VSRPWLNQAGIRPVAASCCVGLGAGLEAGDVALREPGGPADGWAVAALAEEAPGALLTDLTAAPQPALTANSAAETEKMAPRPLIGQRTLQAHPTPGAATTPLLTRSCAALRGHSGSCRGAGVEVTSGEHSAYRGTSRAFGIDKPARPEVLVRVGAARLGRDGRVRRWARSRVWRSASTTAGSCAR